MEITEIIDELKEKYDFNCKTFEVGNGIIYLDKCSINGSDAIYSYSKVYENENIAQKCLNTVCESKIQTGSMYEEKELLLLAKPQYGVKGVYSNNTFDIGVLDCKDVKAYVEVVDNDAYIIFEDQKIKIDSVRNVKQAIANTYDDCGQPTIEIYLLTTDGSIFSSSYTFEYTEECGANKPESINEMIALVKKKDDNFKKKDTINKYDELSFINEKESGPTCAKKVYLTGKKDDVEYIIDNVEKKLTEHYSYTFYREDWWDTGEYYIDLDGKFFIVEESKKKEINIQPIYIFHVYGDNDSCDYLITQDSTLYSICSFNKLQKVKAEKVVKVIYYEGTSAPDSVIYFADGTKLTFSGYLVEDITKSS